MSVNVIVWCFAYTLKKYHLWFSITRSLTWIFHQTDMRQRTVLLKTNNFIGYVLARSVGDSTGHWTKACCLQGRETGRCINSAPIESHSLFHQNPFCQEQPTLCGASPPRMVPITHCVTVLHRRDKPQAFKEKWWPVRRIVHCF